MPLPLSAVLAAQAAATPAEVAACGSPDQASSLCLAIYRATGNEFLATTADTAIVKPAKILLIVVLAFTVSHLIGRAIRRFVRGMTGERVQRRLGNLREHAPASLVDTGETKSRRAVQRAETIGALLRSITAFAVWSVAALMILGELGLDLGPLIAGAGIVGVALGFGAQNLVRDFISGIFMLVEDQYGVGDVIDAGPATGTVEAVSLRTTRLRDVNGVVWHIPNGTIDRIGNKSQQWSRALLDIQVAYDTDVDFAGEVIKGSIVKAWESEKWRDVILEEPQVWGVEDLGADGVTIRVVVKTLPSEQFAVARHLRARIKAGFEEAGIEIPFPQRTVWHRTEDGVRKGAPIALDEGGEPEEADTSGPDLSGTAPSS
ncbi:MAG: mechanosensitive ion channel family protein [Actinobacteria bacterium]|nr:mechanosensitive ion channel family protein [Actinomycetota bacterium]